MVDTGSSVNVLYLDVFKKLKLDDKKLTPIRTQLSGFTGATIEPEGLIRLPVEVGTYPKVARAEMEFIVVNLACVHNIILGRPGIAQIGAIISMPHLCMKFRTPAGVGVLRGDIRSARKCYVKAVQRNEGGSSRVNAIIKGSKAAIREQPEPAEEVEDIRLSDDYPERTVRIGATLPPDLRSSIVEVLREYADIFAWGPQDMPGIARSTICHHLTVNPAARPVK
ncbi:PREDICTED: uncharacterized protein LOC109173560 [Ipomoea nil]|uniref:uncharacterized protein LOC109173560 n=1 Tax=Ipomoea nil TaxID=35883 RepID=UPI0009013CDD|nr:PREDICTED: uncharacterized protein LOC109173560 [Ipomoea nil]